MDYQMSRRSSEFGIRGAGTVLLMALFVMLAVNYAAVSAVQYLQGIDGWISLKAISELEAQGLARVIEGIVKPWLLLGMTFLLLMHYYKRETLQEVSNRFGLIWKPSTLIAAGSFVLGILILVLFSQFLMKIFPPKIAPTKHPLNAISNTSFWLQLIFAITVVTVVPIAEELIFRGALYKGISDAWGKYWAGIVVIVTFISIHPEMIRSGYWVTHSSLYVVSVVLTAARFVTGSLTSSIFIHSGFNFGEVFIF